ECDSAYIETHWLLQLMQNQGLVPVPLVKITHISRGAAHIIAILPNGHYICDCCMSLNLDVVCHHYFAAWIKIPGLPFHISLVRAQCVYSRKLGSETLP
ncbi:hypothetical protein B0H13DRAFT_1535120, partial [Mycena leptocephala]